MTQLFHNLASSGLFPLISSWRIGLCCIFLLHLQPETSHTCLRCVLASTENGDSICKGTEVQRLRFCWKHGLSPLASHPTVDFSVPMGLSCCSGGVLGVPRLTVSAFIRLTSLLAWATKPLWEHTVRRRMRIKV